jgi:glycosyltransferase involved in cell wall biosynthesis
MPVDLAIMTNDGSQGDRVLEVLGAKNNRTRFWMNGVDWEMFTPLPDRQECRRKLHIAASHPLLLTVSRLVDLKRVDRAITALPNVLQGHPDCDLVIVGEGPERGRLEQLAASLEVQAHVSFAGSVPHSNVPEYLAAADVFLSFYDWSNVGNPLLEAMMAGKCIVTLDNGDTRKFVQDGINGVLLPCNDLSGLPQLVKELLADHERRERLGANARRFAEENFWSWTSRIDAEVHDVTKLVERRAREPG